MVRTQIQLTDDQARELKRLAAQRQVSMATLVREAVDQLLSADERAARWERALAAVGRFRSDGSDVSTNHDGYLDDAYMS